MEKLYGDYERMDCLMQVGRRRWLLYYGLFEDENGTFIFHQYFERKPTLAEIKDLIIDAVNDYINERIISGFEWTSVDGDKYAVWLSMENQQNYKAIYDLAVQNNGVGILPVTFKFGTTEQPTYHTFETLEELQLFYIQSVRFIQETYQKGWQEKDSINWENYDI